MFRCVCEEVPNAHGRQGRRAYLLNALSETPPPEEANQHCAKPSPLFAGIREKKLPSGLLIRQTHTGVTESTGL